MSPPLTPRVVVPAGAWVVLSAVGAMLLLTASAFVGVRHLGHTFSPGALSLGRLVIGSLVLGAAVLVSGAWVRASARDWRTMVVIGLLLFGVYNLALNAGERRVDAGTAAMVSQISPIAIAGMASVVLRERLTAPLALGMAVAFGGVAIIASTASGTAGGDLLGVGLCLVSALAYAVSAVLEKPLVGRVPAVQLTWVACTVGAVVCLPAAPTLSTQARQASAVDLGWLVFLGVGPTAVAFTTFAYALRHMTASSLGVTTYLIPPMTVLLSWVYLSETPSTSAYLGGALCLVGVAVARRRRRERSPDRPLVE